MPLVKDIIEIRIIFFLKFSICFLKIIFPSDEERQNYILTKAGRINKVFNSETLLCFSHGQKNENKAGLRYLYGKIFLFCRSNKIKMKFF